jgi:hypothetical protein
MSRMRISALGSFFYYRKQKSSNRIRRAIKQHEKNIFRKCRLTLETKYLRVLSRSDKTNRLCLQESSTLLLLNKKPSIVPRAYRCFSTWINSSLSYLALIHCSLRILWENETINIWSFQKKKEMNILTVDHFLMVSCRKVAPVLHTFFWQQYSQLLLNVSLVILPICLTSGAWSWICGSPRHDEFLHTKITMIHLWENAGLKLKYRLAKPECREKLQYCKKHTLWLYKKRKLDY